MACMAQDERHDTWHQLRPGPARSPVGVIGPSAGSRGRPPDPDRELVARVRAGEEQAFVELVGRHQASLVRLARIYVSSAAVAEEVTQDTWLAVLRGLADFE